jgi:hypothetical protein
MDPESLTVQEALNQGLNFFGVAVLALLAASVIHGLPMGPTFRGRIDDIALILATIALLLWYLRGRNRYRRSAVPLAGLLLGCPSRWPASGSPMVRWYSRERTLGLRSICSWGR